MVKVLVKKLDPKVELPSYKTKGSSGLDLMAFIKDPIVISPNTSEIIPTGIFLAIENDYEIQIRPRSGLAAKKGISVLNTPGTIDSDYRGEVKVILINLSKEKFIVENGMRIAQMIVSPVIQAELEEVKELPSTSRGDGGFGSTGTK